MIYYRVVIRKVDSQDINQWMIIVRKRIPYLKQKFQKILNQQINPNLKKQEFNVKIQKPNFISTLLKNQISKIKNPKSQNERK